jgi:hypothetical protein
LTSTTSPRQASSIVYSVIERRALLVRARCHVSTPSEAATCTTTPHATGRGVLAFTTPWLAGASFLLDTCANGRGKTFLLLVVRRTFPRCRASPNCVNAFVASCSDTSTQSKGSSTGYVHFVTGATGKGRGIPTSQRLRSAFCCLSSAGEWSKRRARIRSRYYTIARGQEYMWRDVLRVLFRFVVCSCAVRPVSAGE